MNVRQIVSATKCPQRIVLAPLLLLSVIMTNHATSTSFIHHSEMLSKLVVIFPYTMVYCLLSWLLDTSRGRALANQKKFFNRYLNATLSPSLFYSIFQAFYDISFNYFILFL